MITHVQTHISIPTAMYLHERAKAQTLLLSCRNSGLFFATQTSKIPLFLIRKT